MYDVSIIIVNYNTPKLTIDCIDSIVRDRSKLKKEIIVVDNASGDDSVHQLSKLEKAGMIILLRNQKNLGFAKATNQGLRISKGKYRLLLNSDTKVKKGAVERLIIFAEKTPDAGAIGAKLINPNGSTQASVFRLPSLDRAVREYWLGEGGLLEKYYPRSQVPVEVESVVMAAFLITPLALKKVGLLDERYFMFFEDHDYCRRIKKVGLKVYYYPHSEVVHYHGASGIGLADAKNQWRRLIPSSKIYHGLVTHYLIYLITWSSQKWKSLSR